MVRLSQLCADLLLFVSVATVSGCLTCCVEPLPDGTCCCVRPLSDHCPPLPPACPSPPNIPASVRHRRVAAARAVKSANKDLYTHNNKDEDNYKWTEPCKWRTNHPQPVILISLGRSGSSITWNTMATLTGERNHAYEVTGGRPESSKTFFSKLQNDPVSQRYTNWTLQRLCHVQREGGRKQNITDQSGIAGFQWKPFATSWNHPYAIKGLQAVANSTDPVVKIVYLTRNPLDRMLSNLRHTKSKSKDAELSPHCAAGDSKCQERHSQFGSNITFPTGYELIKPLSATARKAQTIRERMVGLHIPFVEVAYEKLYGVGKGRDTDNAEEWMKLFRYLQVGPQDGLTMEKVRGVFITASTHQKSRNDTIENFAAVKETLVGTRYEYLLAG